MSIDPSSFQQLQEYAVPIVTAIITSLGTYFIAKRKQSSSEAKLRNDFEVQQRNSNANEFKMLIEANESFRRELKCELALAKKEIEENSKKMNDMEARLLEKDRIILNLRSEVDKLTSRIKELEGKNGSGSSL